MFTSEVKSLDSCTVVGSNIQAWRWQLNFIQLSKLVFLCVKFDLLFIYWMFIYYLHLVGWLCQHFGMCEFAHENYHDNVYKSLNHWYFGNCVLNPPEEFNKKPTNQPTKILYYIFADSNSHSHHTHFVFISHYYCV